jgi:hypothetical protein
MHGNVHPEMIAAMNEAGVDRSGPTLRLTTELAC